MEEEFRLVEENLVGLWKFREHGKPVRWCCTYTVDGNYYDTSPAKTPEVALKKVWQTLRRMKAL